jgi:hypothetical protein
MKIVYWEKIIGSFKFVISTIQITLYQASNIYLKQVTFTTQK